ncbi:MAG: hypothetical protein U0745_05165 [Polyangia bacterium]
MTSRPSWLAEVAQLFDAPTLEAVMGKGGLPHLQARVLLRLGDLYQGSTLAQQAMPSLTPEQARALHSTIATTFNNKAVEVAHKGDYDRASGFCARPFPSPGVEPTAAPARPVQPGRASASARAPDDAKAMLAKLDPVQLPGRAGLARGAVGKPGRSTRRARPVPALPASRRRPADPAAFPSDRAARVGRCDGALYEGAAPGAEPIADPNKAGKRPVRRQP